MIPHQYNGESPIKNDVEMSYGIGAKHSSELRYFKPNTEIQ